MSFADILKKDLPSNGPASAEDIEAIVEPVDNEIVDDLGAPGDVDGPKGDLSSEEERRVDDTITSVITPILVRDEISEKEFKEFVESVDYEEGVNEGFLTERTIVKFDKKARTAQLYEVAVAAIAREKKDPLFRKLQTVYKMERQIKKQLRKKYHSLATKRVKEWIQRAKKSKSGIIAKVVNKLTGK